MQTIRENSLKVSCVFPCTSLPDSVIWHLGPSNHQHGNNVIWKITLCLSLSCIFLALVAGIGKHQHTIGVLHTMPPDNKWWKSQPVSISNQAKWPMFASRIMGQQTFPRSVLEFHICRLYCISYLQLFKAWDFVLWHTLLFIWLTFRDVNRCEQLGIQSNYDRRVNNRIGYVLHSILSCPNSVTRWLINSDSEGVASGFFSEILCVCWQAHGRIIAVTH